MKVLLHKIMSHPDVVAKPLVFFDIGASGDLPTEWSMLAPYSICVAFDADTRDFNVSEKDKRGWKKLFTLNRVIGANAVSAADFFLAQSPYCSSSLEPDSKSLDCWAFSGLFGIKNKVKLPVITLTDAMELTGVKYIDWYKSDTQGTDLRIFDSLPSMISNQIIIADFEPGIIDSYLGEDKLHQLMAYMDKRPFWISGMNIKGSQRINKLDLESLRDHQRRHVEIFIKTAPGWCEICYINDYQRAEATCRDYLLGWVLLTIKREHGFAMYLAREGKNRFDEPLFIDLWLSSKKAISSGYFRLAIKAGRKISRMMSGRK